MDHNIHPEQAVDLSKVSPEKGAADLSKEAIAARERERALYRAGRRARAMSRAFKGIVGNQGRRKHIALALHAEGLIEKEQVPR